MVRGGNGNGNIDRERGTRLSDMGTKLFNYTIPRLGSTIHAPILYIYIYIYRCIYIYIYEYTTTCPPRFGLRPTPLWPQAHPAQQEEEEEEGHPAQAFQPAHEAHPAHQEEERSQTGQLSLVIPLETLTATRTSALTEQLKVIL